MSEKKTYVVKMNGFLRRSDLERFKEDFECQLDGDVIVIDSSIDSISILEPQDAAELVELVYDFLRNRFEEVL